MTGGSHRARLLARGAGAVALAFLASHPAIARPARTARPNVIVIVTDDQGYRDVGFNGSPDIPTPNIDRIAREGVRFGRAYVTFPTCAPSRAGLMTGRYPARFGFDRNPNGDPTDPNGGVPRSELMLPEALKAAGYATKAVGKWHLGTHPTLTPLARGFDEFYGMVEGGHQYYTGRSTMDDISQSKVTYDWYYSKLSDNGARVEFRKYLTDELSDRAIEFVGRKARGQRPFFLYLAYNAPHTPLQATEKYLNRFPDVGDPNRRNYMAMISAVDDGVGRLLALLDRKRIAKDTIVFFLSDNGGLVDTGQRAPWADNGPLRDGKGNLFEGGVRVPFAIRWPAKITGGSAYDRPVSSMDIFATLAGQIGLRTLPSRPLDGVDLIPYLRGARHGDPHAALFWRKTNTKTGAVVAGDTKYISDPKGTALYDLGRDVGETTDIASRRPADKAKLDALYSAWFSRMATTPAFPPLGSWPRKAAPDASDKSGGFD